MSIVYSCLLQSGKAREIWLHAVPSGRQMVDGGGGGGGGGANKEFCCNVCPKADVGAFAKLYCYLICKQGEPGMFPHIT